MDRALLKERAKRNIGKRRGETIVVALILTMTLGGGAGFSFNFRFNNNDYNVDDNIFNANFDFSQLYGILSDAVSIALVISLAIFVIKSIVLSALGVGSYRYFLKLRCDEPTGIGEVIGNFKDGNYLNILVIMLLKQVFTFLWSLLFVIPGIIKGIEYSVIPFILSVRPDINRKEAFRLAKALTDGHKGELFVLSLSFIGWELLSALTCGILAIVYVNPYFYATQAEFYSELRKDAIQRGAIRPEELPDYESAGFSQNGFGGFRGGQYHHHFQCHIPDAYYN